MERFKIERSNVSPDKLVVTDTNNMIVVKFTEHHFNDSQEVTALNNHPADVMTMARAMREIGDWLAINHKDIIL